MAVDTLTINNMEPPPKTPMYISPGVMSSEWERWFYNLFLRVGGSAGDAIYDTVNASAAVPTYISDTTQDALINNTTTIMPAEDVMALIDASSNAALAFMAQNPIAPLTQYMISTAAQSVFNLAINVYSAYVNRAYTIVVVNGGVQIESVDFNITGAQQITFTTPLHLNDDVVIYAWSR